MRIALILTIVILASGCTTVPEQIQGEFTEVSPARVDPAVFGSEVRWGGVILSARNTGKQTCFEILSRDLDKYLRPEVEDDTAGRYIACKDGFHDPLVFTKGREVTMTGEIRNIEVRKLDDFDYRYPVLDVDHLVLWEKRRNVVVYRGFNDPWAWHYPYRGWGWGWGWGHPWRGPYPGMSHGWAETRTLLPDPSIVESSSSDSRE
jgi:outer membrane lipoprotein